MIDPDNLPQEPGQLAKVLPAGAPLVVGDADDERDYADENAALAAGRLQTTVRGSA